LTQCIESVCCVRFLSRSHRYENNQVPIPVSPKTQIFPEDYTISSYSKCFLRVAHRRHTPYSRKGYKRVNWLPLGKRGVLAKAIVSRLYEKDVLTKPGEILSLSNSSYLREAQFILAKLIH
jgi:hypothetical protein